MTSTANKDILNDRPQTQAKPLTDFESNSKSQAGAHSAQEPLLNCNESKDKSKQPKPKPVLKASDKTKTKTGEAIQQYQETSKEAYLASFETGKQEGEAIADIERQGSHLGYINRKAQHLIEDTIARGEALPQFREMIETQLAEAEEFQKILEEGKPDPLERLEALKAQRATNSEGLFTLFLGS